MIEDSTIIVGAGPAGLAIASRLRERDVQFEILEQGSVISPAWHSHYDRLRLHTVKSHSSLPFVPFPDSYPTYVSRQQLVEYLTAYAERFEIEPQFDTSVTKIQRDTNKWVVETSRGAKLADNIIMATGINRIPYTPDWPGSDLFEGDLIHSRAYRSAKPFLGKRCLVVGMGNTGAEIALDLAEHDIPVSISVRGPVNIVPRDAFGRPTQATALQLSKLPTWLQDSLAKLTQRITIGDLSQFGLTTPEIAPTAQLRELGKTPVIDLGTVGRIKEGDILIRPDIRKLKTSGVEFVDGTNENYDTLIACTGYRAGLTQIFPSVAPVCDSYGNPTITIGDGNLEGAYFLGFDNFRPGGILGIINTDSKKIADHLTTM